MNWLLTNFYRLICVSFYPVVLLVSFFLLNRKKRYHYIFKMRLSEIITNTILFTIIGVAVLFVFFKLENTIYSYDYSGHWIRTLYLKKWFFENPYSLLGNVYDSMNYADYSYLPALMMLGISLVSSGYGWFCISIFVSFVVPLFVLLQVYYYSLFSDRPRLVLFAGLVFFPLWFVLFNGEVDVGVPMFFMMMYLLTFHQSFNEIDWVDNLSVNIFAFLLIFFRRYSLYVLVVFYANYVLKYIFEIHFVRNKNHLRNFSFMICSGLLMLIVILLFFRPYFLMVINNRFSEVYAAYDHTGKLSAAIGFFSLPILATSAFGIYCFYKERDFETIVVSLIQFVVPLILIWQIQIQEQHHYSMVVLPLFFLFIKGVYGILEHFRQAEKLATSIVAIVLVINTLIIFSDTPAIKCINTARRQPKTYGVEDIRQLSLKLFELTDGDGISAYLASGSSFINDDLLRNANLPDLETIPTIDSAILDLRDGFPKDLQHIRYIVTFDPIQYYNKPYQHIYDIISNALWNEPIVRNIYTEVYSQYIDDVHVVIYEKTGDFSPVVKEYFYNEILRYYPDKADEFSYILD